MSGNKKGKRVLRPIADGTYQVRHEHNLCKTPTCRNVIAVWAKGSGYCASCRKKR